MKPWRQDTAALYFERDARLAAAPPGQNPWLGVGLEEMITCAPLGSNAAHLWPRAPNVVITDYLGAGGFGATFKVLDGHVQRALKVSVNVDAEREAAASEIAVLRRLAGVRGVAQLCHFAFNAELIFLLLELGEGGSLTRYKDFSPECVRRIMT
jgi:hypothetical protein